MCENLDGTKLRGTYNCFCPPGMTGDGVTRCDVYTYATIFTLGIDGVNQSDVNTSSLIENLYTWGVIPASVPRQSVSATVGPYSPIRRRRMLLWRKSRGQEVASVAPKQANDVKEVSPHSGWATSSGQSAIPPAVLSIPSSTRRSMAARSQSTTVPHGHRRQSSTGSQVTVEITSGSSQVTIN